jgi:hypothetical protein
MTITLHCRLEGLVREYKQALKVSESEREALENAASKSSHTQQDMTTPIRGIPARSSTPDTPSKDVVLDSEPHGAEFEYFKNVLFEYMMGRQNQHLLKVIAALARFTEAQKKQLYARASYFTNL